MKTLQIKSPFGGLLIYSLFYLVLLCSVLEFAARTSLTQGILQYESYGSSHPQFETQILQINARQALQGQIDCIFIGNSQVLYGIDPLTVEQTFLEKTGETIHCQNFGLGGMPPMTARSVAELLISQYHPSVIVFGTGLWDYTSSAGNESIVSSPWVQYKLGIFSVDGWLFDHSQAYRLIFGLDRHLQNMEGDDKFIDPTGHSTLTGHAQLTTDEQKEYFYTIAKRPEITQLQRDGFRELLALNSAETRIIIMEMPSDPIFYSMNRKARNLHPEFEAMLISETTLSNTHLWLTQNSVTIPADGWYDLLHLNEEGAIYFSRLLGGQMALMTPSLVKAKQP